MGKFLKNLTLLQQTYLLFGGFAFLALVNYVVIENALISTLSFNSQFQELKNLRNQTNYFEEISLKAAEDTIKVSDLKKNMAYIESTLSTFKGGGTLPFTKTKVKSGSDELISTINRLQEKWTAIKKAQSTLLFEPQKIDTTVQQSVLVQVNDSVTATEIQNKTISIDNKAFKEAHNLLKLELPQFLSLQNELSTILSNDREDSKRWFELVLLFFLGFNLIAITLVLILIKKNLFNPLNSLGVLISDEKFDRKSDYVQNNELGLIAKSINHLVDVLESSTDFVRKIGEGKINESIEGISEEDVRQGSLQAALFNMRNQMKKMDEEESERNWTTHGLAKFVDILRANDNVQELSDEIISSLVEYTKSNQGGIYIINEEDEDDKFLELISLYAFDTKKFDTRKYRMGEGLVGQTYLEKKTIYLLDVPNDYIQIGSGLGDANPSTILLVPLKIENDIYGVIELASFHEYKEYQIQFVEKLGESIAATIAGVKGNQKTKQLLEESQQLTEQMQAQEEEMRQNMEELTATQEEMGRKEQAVNAQIDAINNSLGMCEYSAEGEIQSANKVFMGALGFDQAQIGGFNFYTLHGSNQLLEELKDGKSWSGWLPKNHAGGNKTEMKSYFNPVLGDSGELLKIIEIVTQFEKDSDSPMDSTGTEELNEVEEELRQQMEELEITQEQLNNKLSFSLSLLDSLSSKNFYFIYNEKGVIHEQSEAASNKLGEFENIKDLIDINLDSIKTNQDELKLKLKADGHEVEAMVRKLNRDKGENKFLIIWH